MLTLDLADQTLFVGGDWSAPFAGAERDGLAALDAATGRLVDWEPTSRAASFHPNVLSLAHNADHEYVGGYLPLEGYNSFVVFAR